MIIYLIYRCEFRVVFVEQIIFKYLARPRTTADMLTRASVVKMSRVAESDMFPKVKAYQGMAMIIFMRC